MLKRLSLATTAVLLAAAMGAAANASSSVSSDVTFDLFQCTDCSVKRGVVGEHGWVAGGEVSAGRADCVPNRKVKLVAVFQTAKRGGPIVTRELVDVDRTSDHGAWSGRFRADLIGIDHLEAKLTRKTVGPKGHSHVCDADLASFFPVT